MLGVHRQTCMLQNMIWHYMTWNLFTAIGFPPGGSGRRTSTKIGKGQNEKNFNTKNNTTQNTQNRKK